MWDLSSPTRDQTCVPCIGRWILNHWTTRKAPGFCFFSGIYLGAEFLGNIAVLLLNTRASLVAQVVKNLPATQETEVQSLGQEDFLEKGMATHSSILDW